MVLQKHTCCCTCSCKDLPVSAESALRCFVMLMDWGLFCQCCKGSLAANQATGGCVAVGEL
jgi:hypothetical protein